MFLWDECFWNKKVNFLWQKNESKPACLNKEMNNCPNSNDCIINSLLLASLSHFWNPGLPWPLGKDGAAVDASCCPAGRKLKLLQFQSCPGSCLHHKSLMVIWKILQQSLLILRKCKNLLLFYILKCLQDSVHLTLKFKEINSSHISICNKDILICENFK